MKSMIPDWLPKLFVKAEGSVREATTKKFSDFGKITDTEGMEVVGIKGGANVRADFPVAGEGGETGPVTTSMVGLEPDDPLRNTRGQFMSTKELPELSNQKDANRFIASELQRLEQDIDGIEIPEAIDLTGYATEEYVDDSIAAIEFPDGVDLTGYATEDWVTDQIDGIEFPPGTVVSGTAPADPTEGANWYDTVRLELFVFAEGAWLPCSPLGARVEQGEAVQAQILDQIQESLIEQETLKDKVSALEGAIGEHSLTFTSTNTNPRGGEFNLKSEALQLTTFLSESKYMTLNEIDLNGNTINLDRIVVGDVLRLSDTSRQVAELKITDITDRSIFEFEKLSGDLERFSGGRYDFILLSSFDPAGIATIDYVDSRDDTKLDKAGGTVTGNIAMSGKSITGLAEPTANAHAATKKYVDALRMDVAYISARPPGVMFEYQSGSTGLNDRCFQWFQSDSRLRISTKGVDIDWLADGFTFDYDMSYGPYFTIWYMPSFNDPNHRPEWKVRKFGRIDRIDWHKEDLLCYITSSRSNANLTAGATYYITIGGIF